MNSICCIDAIPAAFQYRAEASAATLTNAPPIPIAEAPTGISRNVAATVPVLETFLLNICASSTAGYIKNNSINIFFITTSYSQIFLIIKAASLITLRNF
jgi:hypothetical protein